MSTSASDTGAKKPNIVFTLPVVGTFVTRTALTYALLHKYNSPEKQLQKAQAAVRTGTATSADRLIFRTHLQNSQFFTGSMHVGNVVMAVGAGLAVTLPLVGYNFYRHRISTSK